MATTAAAATMSSTTASASSLQQVVHSQLASLNDSDPHATAWTAALRRASTASNKNRVSWGGRGQGGRGRARKTYQPHNVVVDNISLVYPGSQLAKQQRTLLEDASLKLLLAGGRRHVYALLGPNGCGKSSLLRRIHAGAIPGFPPHISTLYIPQEVVVVRSNTSDDCWTVLDELMTRYQEFHAQSKQSAQYAIQDLELQMENLDLTQPQDQECMEKITEQIASLEEEMIQDHLSDDGNNPQLLRQQALHAISFMMDSVGSCDDDIINAEPEIDWSMVPMASLSMGLRKKVILATALLCPCDLLLLDEPANALDISGLLQLRRLLAQLSGGSDGGDDEPLQQQQQQSSSTTTFRTTTTVLLVSHDIDLINEVATDVIEMRNHKLVEYPGCNYELFLKAKAQEGRHLQRQGAALEKKQAALQQTLQHLKTQPVSKRRGAAKKRARQLGAHRKKMERVAGDQKNHEAELQAANLQQMHHGAGTSSGVVKAAAMAAPSSAASNKGTTTGTVSSSSRGTAASAAIPAEKAIQFVFRDPTSQWGEPLILAFDVGHGYNLPPLSEKEIEEHSPVNEEGLIVKKKGYLFDYVDLCVEEGGTYCILGRNASGKSTLLRILGKLMDPVEGKVKHALNVEVGYLDQELVDNMIQTGLDDGAQDALNFLSQRFPQKTQQEIRGELTNFGINPLQATTNLSLLSGGERSRVCLAAVMLNDPHVLLLDNPTSNLDPQSVDFLICGLKQWKGTLVLVSHDAHLVRSLEAQCYVLMANEGKLRRVEGGVDDYLRSFVAT